jgi:hypothetical protein
MARNAAESTDRQRCSVTDIVDRRARSCEDLVHHGVPASEVESDATAERPANSAAPPSSASMRRSRFHLAVRSDRIVDPTLIYM